MNTKFGWEKRSLSDYKVRIDFIYIAGIDDGLSSTFPFSHHDDISSPLGSMEIAHDQVVNGVVLRKEFMILAEYVKVDGSRPVVGQ